MAAIRDKSSIKKDGLNGKRGFDSIDEGMYDDISSQMSAAGMIMDDGNLKRRKRDKKKEKKDKKEKKKKDKKHKESRSSKNDDEDGEDQRIKQQLFEDITHHLKIEQKKGIIPIVFEMNQDDPKMQKEH